MMNFTHIQGQNTLKLRNNKRFEVINDSGDHVDGKVQVSDHQIPVQWNLDGTLRDESKGTQIVNKKGFYLDKGYDLIKI